MLPKVFVIILNWNGYRDTAECLRSLKRLIYPSCEVVVVDNRSTDGSVTKLQEEFKEVVYIENKENLGFAEGNNVGIRYALEHGADYVLLLNNDTLIKADFLEALVKTAEVDEQIGIAGPKIYEGLPDSIRLWYAGGSVDWKRMKTVHRGFHEDDRGEWDQVEDVDFVSGCAMLIRRPLLERIGLLDDRYFLYYEDTDYCVRACKAGFRIVYVPQAVVYHKAWTSSGGQSSPLRLYYMTRNRLLLMESHLDRGAKRRFLLYFFYDGILRRAVYLVVKGKSPVKGIHALWDGLADFRKKRFYRGPDWLHQRKSGTATELRVAMFPYIKEHPYVRLLAEGLERHGVVVERNTRWFPVWLLRKNGNKPVLHFHWPSLFYQSKKLPLLTIYRFPLFIVLASIAKILNYRIVWTVHNLYPHETVVPSFLEQWLRGMWARRFVDHMIVHCPSAEKMIRREFNSDKSVSIIPHGNFIGFYPDKLDKEEARGRLKISRDSFVYLHFGLIKGYKGIEGMIEVFKKIRCPQDILVIAGRPVESSVCQAIERVNDKQMILRLKKIGDDEVQTYFRACDVVVLPYRDILTSGNLLLAMSFSRPAIIPAVGCVPETVDSECAILYNPMDAGELEKAMREVKGLDVEKMGQHAHERAKRYDWDTIAEKTKVVYAMVGGGK